ncbi:synaptobrevin homolog YKT6 [Anopheles ziemanni]|uniref:synaptobrevin homolog YKT6 n=1 Tax=Anopheles coustani TaxID=139045 RepID=UPI00265B39BC|nr:synaptobrevin homolog YKT6 [Anopheles coustani]XP_058127097.1 synaptobrevin homolog YKT6 [Anopheles coustani]XP_058175912.1 synaptobrevin homolog YKT6 [Anopheles ziemanni]
MVKLYAISVFYKAPTEARLLKSSYDLQSFSFFQRGSVQEFISFASKTLVERTQAATRQSVKQDVYMCHVYVRADNLGAVLIADHEYPQRVGHTLLTKVLDDFSAKVSSDQWAVTTNEAAIQFGTLPATLSKYQDPREADALTRMQEDLDETKIILKNTIESVLERGEKLDDLVYKSESLSIQSKAFYKTAKKTNSCCNFA